MKKRLICLALILILLVSALPLTALAAEGLSNFKRVRSYPAGKFTDVTSDKWFYENVKGGYEFGLIDGRTETSYGPDLYITNAELFKLTACLRSIYYTGTANFKQGAPWYQVYIDYGIDAGYLDESMRNAAAYADMYVPRCDIAFFFSIALPEDAFEFQNFVPDESIPDVTMVEYYSESVYLLYRAGILTGKDDYGTFAPEDFVLRSEVATMLSRIVDESLREEFVLRRVERIISSASYLSLDVGDTATVELEINDNRFIDGYYNCDPAFLDITFDELIDRTKITMHIKALSSGSDFIEVGLVDANGNGYGIIYILVDVNYG